eukprot:403332023
MSLTQSLQGVGLAEVDVFDLSNKYNMFLLFDCPTKDNTSYQNFSQDILKNMHEVLILFLDTEIPPQFVQALQLNRSNSNSGNGNQSSNVTKNGSNNNLLQSERSSSNNLYYQNQGGIPSNLISTYDSSLAWLLTGIFSSQNNKQVHIFTDQIEFFKSKLQTQTYERRLKSNVFIQSCSDVVTFSVDLALNPWSQFDNKEVLSNYEVEQLQAILKKFIKQVVTSKHPHNLEKLINISQNLVKAHLSSIQKEKYKVHSDLTFHFVRSLFLDNVLENEIITSAILTNQIRDLTDFENFTKISYTQKFQQIIEQIQKSIQDKQAQAQKALNEQNQRDQAETKQKDRKMAQDEEDQLEISEEKVIFQAVQVLLDQYLHLFHKGKIFEIKKLLKLVKQIQNYVVGFIKKNETAPQNNKVKNQVQILEKNTRLISINILRVIVAQNLIKQVDANQIEHDASKVAELLQQQQIFMKNLKESDLIFDLEYANQMFEMPNLVFKKEKEEAKQDTANEAAKKDPIDIIIEKLYHQMKASKHYPNSLRELERLIKKHIVKKSDPQLNSLQNLPGVSNQGMDEDKTVELVMQRMNQKGMFTQKLRTGESKENAKDPKLRNVDIIELYKKEKKEDIPIVFESSLLNSKTNLQHQSHISSQHASNQMQSANFNHGSSTQQQH